MSPSLSLLHSDQRSHSFQKCHCWALVSRDKTGCVVVLLMTGIMGIWLPGSTTATGTGSLYKITSLRAQRFWPDSSKLNVEVFKYQWREVCHLELQCQMMVDGNTNTPTLSVAGDERSKIVCGAVSQWLPVSCKLSWVVLTR